MAMLDHNSIRRTEFQLTDGGKVCRKPAWKRWAKRQAHRMSRRSIYPLLRAEYRYFETDIPSSEEDIRAILAQNLATYQWSDEVYDLLQTVSALQREGISGLEDLISAAEAKHNELCAWF